MSVSNTGGEPLPPDAGFIARVYGVRLFILDSNNSSNMLQPPVHTSSTTSWTRLWGRGVCPYFDSVMPVSHMVDCTCGLYSSFCADSTLSLGSHSVVLAVVALEGDVLEYDEGYRSQNARVVSLSPVSRDVTVEQLSTIFKEEIDAFEVSVWESSSEMLLAYGLKMSQLPSFTRCFKYGLGSVKSKGSITLTVVMQIAIILAAVLYNSVLYFAVMTTLLMFYEFLTMMHAYFMLLYFHFRNRSLYLESLRGSQWKAN